MQVLTLLAMGSLAAPASAHSGGKDKDGCHKNSRTGEKHCHGKKQQFDPSKPARIGDDGVLYGDPVRIIDGDTLVVKIQGAKMSFRLSGIDAPELDQPFGIEARKELASIIGNQPCVMQVVEADAYGRTVVHLWIGDVYVNGEMMKRGMAWFESEFAPGNALQLLEEDARDRKLGLWAGPKDKRMEPWEWRRRARGADKIKL